MDKAKRKIAIVTGGRIEFGYVSPIIREIQKRPHLDYEIIAANMHMLENFGHTIEDLKKEHYKIGAEVYNTLDGYNRLTMVKSLGIFLIELPGILERMKPDIILVAGDRGEPFIAAMVGAHLYIPVAHIQAGELSGNIDGMTRHATTKYAHIHLAANQDAAERVLKMGEQPERVFNVGAPMLDELVGGRLTATDDLYKKYNLTKGQPLILMIQHPVTEEFNQSEKHIRETLAALTSLGHQTIIILSNSDAGNAKIREVIAKNSRPFLRVVSNLPREDYSGLMKIADVLVGNSSSGIIEAPTFKLPVVNIGTRQAGRLQASNVINAGYAADEIKAAIVKVLSSEFKAQVKNCANPYGDGHSAPRIVDILEKITINEDLLIKKLTY